MCARVVVLGGDKRRVAAAAVTSVADATWGRTVLVWAAAAADGRRRSFVRGRVDRLPTPPLIHPFHPSRRLARLFVSFEFAYAVIVSTCGEEPRNVGKKSFYRKNWQALNTKVFELAREKKNKIAPLPPPPP